MQHGPEEVAMVEWETATVAEDTPSFAYYLT